MSLLLTVSCFSKIQIGFTFLVPAHLGSPGQRAIKRVCVCVCNICMIFVQSNAASCEITLSVIINVVCCGLQDLFTDVQHVALMWLFRTSMWSIHHALSSANPVTQASLLQVSMKMELWSASVSHLCHCFSSLLWYWQTVWALLLSFYQYTLCSVHRFSSVVKPQKPVKMYS